MKSKFTILAIIIACLLAAPLRAADAPKPADVPTSDPRAAAVITLFNAALANDAAAFRASLSTAQASNMLDERLARLMHEVSSKYRQFFKETKPQDLNYAYAGDDKQGGVIASSKEDKSKVAPKMFVTKEGDAWKVNLH